MAASPNEASRSLSLWKLAWPLTIELLLQLLIGTADTMMVSRISDDAVAVVGISNQFFSAMIVLFGLIGSGLGVVIARKLGAGRPDDARKAGAMALSLTFVLGTVLSLLIRFAADPIARLLHVPERLAPMAVQYIGIVGCGMMITASIQILGTAIRNTGNTKTPMFVSFGMNVAHIALNYGFITGAWGFPQWGLFGVAISTVASRAAAFVVLLYTFRHAFSRPIKPADLVRFDGGLFREIVEIGWPMAIGSGSYMISQVVLYSMIASLGTVQLTARVYMGTIESFLISGGWALAMALQIQVAHYCGGGHYESAYRSAFRVFRIGLLAMLAGLGAAAACFRPILHMFTSSGDVIAVMLPLLGLTALFMPCKMLNFAFNTSLTAVGDTKYIMVTNLLFTWAICVGLAYMLGILLGLGIYGVYIAMILDEGIRGVLVLRRWHRRLYVPAAQGIAMQGK